MFNLFKKKKPEKPSRNIFGFWNGSEHVWMDPVKIEIALETSEDYEPELINRVWKQSDAGALQTLVKAICEVFGVKEWDGKEGLTIEELVYLLHDFHVWEQDVKKNMKPLRQGLQWAYPFSRFQQKKSLESGSTGNGSTTSGTTNSTAPLKAESQAETVEDQANESTRADEETKELAETGQCSSSGEKDPTKGAESDGTETSGIIDDLGGKPDPSEGTEAD